MGEGGGWKREIDRGREGGREGRREREGERERLILAQEKDDLDSKAHSQSLTHKFKG